MFNFQKPSSETDWDKANKTGQKQLLGSLCIEVFVDTSGHKSFNVHWDIPYNLHSEEWRILATLIAEFYQRVERKLPSGEHENNNCGLEQSKTPVMQERKELPT